MHSTAIAGALNQPIAPLSRVSPLFAVHVWDLERFIIQSSYNKTSTHGLYQVHVVNSNDDKDRGVS